MYSYTQTKLAVKR